MCFYRLQASGSSASLPTMSAPSDISVSTSSDTRHRRPTGSPDSIKLEQVTPPTSPSRQERSLSNPGLLNSIGGGDQLYMAPRSSSTSAVSVKCSLCYVSVSVHSVCMSVSVHSVCVSVSIHSVCVSVSIHSVCVSVSIHSECVSVSVHSVCECVCVSVSVHSVCMSVSVHSVCDSVSVHSVCVSISVHSVCICVS